MKNEVIFTIICWMPLISSAAYMPVPEQKPITFNIYHLDEQLFSIEMAHRAFVDDLKEEVARKKKVSKEQVQLFYNDPSYGRVPVTDGMVHRPIVKIHNQLYNMSISFEINNRTIYLDLELED